VVDLGCAPGGWLQAASRFVGAEGAVLGVDVRPIGREVAGLGVEFMEGDILDSTLPERILDRLGRKADIVLCDASPNISGVWEVDHARQIHLARAALNIARLTLGRRGCFFAKVFEGPSLKEYITEVKRCFQDVRLHKPEASKAKSSELYLLGRVFKGCRDLSQPVTDSVDQ